MPIPSRPTEPTTDEPNTLARTSDPVTSQRAVASLNLSLKDSDRVILTFLATEADEAMATDIELAEMMVERGHYHKDEQARRRVRTLREELGLIRRVWLRPNRPATRMNPSGVEGQLNCLTEAGHRKVASWRSDQPKA